MSDPTKLDPRVLNPHTTGPGERGASVEKEVASTFAQAEEGLPGGHAAGWLGERGAAFMLGEKGYMILLGPGGSAGHQLTDSGADFLAYDPNKHELLFGDNKAKDLTIANGKIYDTYIKDSTALTSNLPKAVNGAISKIEKTSALPAQIKQEVLLKLNRLRAVLNAGGGPAPEGIRFVITNSGGYSIGIADKLQEQFKNETGLKDASGQSLKIEHMDLVGREIIEARKQDIAKGIANEVPTGRGKGNKSTVIEPESILPKSLTGKTRKALGQMGEMEWIFLLELVQAIVLEILRFFPTVLEEDLKQKWPTIRSFLQENPDSGVILAFSFTRQAMPDLGKVMFGEDPYGIRIYQGLSLYFGKTADQAYLNYLSNLPLLDVDLVGKGESRVTLEFERVFVWYSATENYRYPRL
jgi:hypothetical protein